ncbi:MAG: ATP synthase F0 subunit B [Omnitrophica bacterium GWA2_52_8]|nr:MAG: ATP synthase F0 subunit B [Omnitrophica bacterium GWA2_52_8]
MDFFKQNIIPGEVLVQLLAFLIVFGVLRALAWKPILSSLASRRNRIKKSFDDIETAKRDVERLKSDYHRHLQRIDDEARAKLQEAIDEGRRISKEIQEKARLESQAVFEKSKESLTLEISKARAVLRREIADLSVEVAEKIIREKLTGDRQQEKIMEIIEDLEKTP